jgi:hypothetical protein
MANSDDIAVEDFLDSYNLTDPVTEKEIRSLVPNGGLLA